MNMPPNLNKMLEQAQKLQEEMAAAQDKLEEEKIEASARAAAWSRSSPPARASSSR